MTSWITYETSLNDYGANKYSALMLARQNFQTQVFRMFYIDCHLE